MNDYIVYTQDNNEEGVLNFLKKNGVVDFDNINIDEIIREILAESSVNVEEFLKIHPDFDVLKEIYKKEEVNNTIIQNVKSIDFNVVRDSFLKNEMLKYISVIVIVALIIKVI